MITDNAGARASFICCKSINYKLNKENSSAHLKQEANFVKEKTKTENIFYYPCSAFHLVSCTQLKQKIFSKRLFDQSSCMQMTNYQAGQFIADCYQIPFGLPSAELLFVLTMQQKTYSINTKNSLNYLVHYAPLENPVYRIISQRSI